MITHLHNKSVYYQLDKGGTKRNIKEALSIDAKQEVLKWQPISNSKGSFPATKNWIPGFDHQFCL